MAAARTAARLTGALIGWSGLLLAAVALHIGVTLTHIQFSKATLTILLLSAACAVLAGRLAMRDARAGANFRLQCIFCGQRAWIGAAALGMAIALGLLATVEAVYFERLEILGPKSQFFKTTIRDAGLKRDPVFGISGSPGTYRHAVEAIAPEPPFDVTYSYDADGHRVTPQAAAAEPSRHALFLGCSFTFGVGCSDMETIPARFAADAPVFRAYNLAISGWGPAQTLLLFERGTPQRLVKEPEGVAFYLYIEDHLRRTISTMRRRSWISADYPCFHLVDGRPQYLGTFRTAEPYRSALYKLMAFEQVALYHEMDWPLSISDEQIRTSARILSESARRYRLMNPDGDFYVVIHPSCGDTPDTKRFIAMLGEDAVRVLDLRPDGLALPEMCETFCDAHPTPRSQRLVAHRLAEMIQAGTE